MRSTLNKRCNQANSFFIVKLQILLILSNVESIDASKKETSIFRFVCSYSLYITLSQSINVLGWRLLRVHKREARKELIACNPRSITIPCLVGQGSIVPIFQKKRNVISILVSLFIDYCRPAFLGWARSLFHARNGYTSKTKHFLSLNK